MVLPRLSGLYGGTDSRMRTKSGLIESLLSIIGMKGMTRSPDRGPWARAMDALTLRLHALLYDFPVIECALWDRL